MIDGTWATKPVDRSTIRADIIRAIEHAKATIGAPPLPQLVYLMPSHQAMLGINPQATQTIIMDLRDVEPYLMRWLETAEGKKCFEKWSKDDADE